jgi:leucyl-tRNA synthetase
VQANASEDDVVAKALEVENVAKYIEGKKRLKTIFVPGRLVNVVVK